MARSLAVQQELDLRLLAGVEEMVRGPHRPVLGEQRRVVGVEAVGGHRGRVHEASGAGGSGRPEGVERAVDVDAAGGGRRGGAEHLEGEVDDHVGPGERGLQRGRVPDVAPPVGQLGPAVPGRVERPAGDADHMRDPLVRLQQWDQPEAERAGRTGHRHGELRSGGAGHHADATAPRGSVL
jgi:hypothetical protein